MDNHALPAWKKALSSYRSHFMSLLPGILILIMMGLIVSASSLFSGLLLLLLTPFLFVPFFSALQMYSSFVSNDAEMGNVTFPGLVRGYFHSSFFGSYRVTWSLLTSYLLSSIFSFLIVLVFSSVAMNSWPEFMQDLNLATKYISSGDLNSLNLLMASSYPLNVAILIQQVATWAPFILSFIHQLLKNSHLALLRGGVFGGNIRLAMMIQKSVWKGGHPSYRKEYYKGTWPLYIVIALSFVVFALIGFYAVPWDAAFLQYGIGISSFGLMGVALVLPFYLPYHFLLIEILAKGREGEYATAAREINEQMLRNLQQYQKVSEEEARRLREALRQDKETEAPETKEGEEKPNGNDKVDLSAYGYRDGDKDEK